MPLQKPWNVQASLINPDLLRLAALNSIVNPKDFALWLHQIQSLLYAWIEFQVHAPAREGCRRPRRGKNRDWIVVQQKIPFVIATYISFCLWPLYSSFHCLFHYPYMSDVLNFLFDTCLTSVRILRNHALKRDGPPKLTRSAFLRLNANWLANEIPGPTQVL